MADRFNINSQIEHLQMKYLGTGHADITKYEWIVNHHRDSLASYIGHSDITALFAVGQNQSMARVRYQLLLNMIKPCGDSPNKED